MTKTPKTAGGVDDLDNADRRRVLGIIDQFRELGMNEDISLPQVYHSGLDRCYGTNPSQITTHSGN